MMIGCREQLAGFISDLFFQAPALANYFEAFDTRAFVSPIDSRPPVRPISSWCSRTGASSSRGATPNCCNSAGVRRAGRAGKFVADASGTRRHRPLDEAWLAELD
jgi:hypothetical protein